MRFQDNSENNMNLNQLTFVTVDRIPMTKEAKLPKISAMPDETVDFIRDTIMVSKFYYSLIRSMVSVGRMIRRTWMQIRMRRKWRALESTMKESITWEYF